MNTKEEIRLARLRGLYKLPYATQEEILAETEKRATRQEAMFKEKLHYSNRESILEAYH